MVKIRTLVPLTNPKTGDQLAVGDEVDVDVETAADWRADGKVSYVSDEQAAAKAAETGSYSARTTREDAPKSREKK
jgi:hypothetical protein